MPLAAGAHLAANSPRMPSPVPAEAVPPAPALTPGLSAAAFAPGAAIPTQSGVDFASLAFDALGPNKAAAMPGRAGAAAAFQARVNLAQLLPPIPKIPSARYPARPLVDASLDEEDAVLALVRGYTEAISFRMGKRFFSYANLKKAKALKNLYPVILNGCVELSVRSIPPSAWIDFRLDAWSKMAAKAVSVSGPRLKAWPPLHFVFNAESIQKWHGWFFSEAATYLFRREIIQPSKRQLLTRWDALRQLAFSATCEAELQSMKSRILSDATYSSLVGAAAMEKTRIEYDLGVKVASGKHIW